METDPDTGLKYGAMMGIPNDNSNLQLILKEDYDRGCGNYTINGPRDLLGLVLVVSYI
jgi:hypothetical protein